MSDSFFVQNGQEAHNHDRGLPQADALYEALRAVFPATLRDNYQAFMDQYQHEFLNEPVLRACMLTQDAKELTGADAGACHRLFGMQSGTSVLYTTELEEEPVKSFLSPNSYVMAKTVHHEEFGRPCRPEMLNFTELFFVAPLSELQSFYGLSLTEIPPGTVFSAIVANGQVVGIRRYTSETDNLLGQWQSIYVLFCKKARRMDLARRLMNLEFLDEY